MSSLTSILTATPNTPPSYNVGMAETFSWIPVEGAGRPLYARATYLANPEDIKVSLSGSNITVNGIDQLELNTDDVEELIQTSNTRLDVLTAVDYATEAKQNSTITLLQQLTANTDALETLLQTSNTLLDSISAKEMTISLDVSAINLNTDEIEGLIETSNTLLNTLTAKTTVTDVSNIETKLDALTAVDYSTETKQDSIITLLSQLTANTDSLEVNTDSVESLIVNSNTRLDVLTAVDYATESKQDSIITLLDSLTAKESTISLDVSAINVNTDEIEGLIKQSNTLLDSLTAKTTTTDVSNIESRLDALTAVDYATSTKQDTTITLLDQLTANTNSVETLLQTSNTLLDSLTGREMTISLDVSAINLNTDGIESLVETSNTLLNALTAKTTVTDVTNVETKLDVLTAVDYATEGKQDTTITLLNSITSANVYVPGFRIPPYDEIELSYYGSTNNLNEVKYKDTSTVVLALSFTYTTTPPTANDATLTKVKRTI